jgi:hypothetical protein
VSPLRVEDAAVLTAVQDASRREDAVPSGLPDRRSARPLWNAQVETKKRSMRPDKKAIVDRVVFDLPNPRPVTVGGQVAGRDA